MRGPRQGFSGALALVFISMTVVFGACSSKGIRGEVVASVNGDGITVEELREFLGFRGGATPATGVPVAKKKEALDRLIAGRLLAQDARSSGLDNTEEYRKAVAQNEGSVWISALLRKEVAAKLKITDDAVKAEAKKLREADKNLSEVDAGQRATQALLEAQLRKINSFVPPTFSPAGAARNLPASCPTPTRPPPKGWPSNSASCSVSRR